MQTDKNMHYFHVLRNLLNFFMEDDMLVEGLNFLGLHIIFSVYDCNLQIFFLYCII